MSKVGFGTDSDLYGAVHLMQIIIILDKYMLQHEIYVWSTKTSILLDVKLNAQENCILSDIRCITIMRLLSLD